MTFNETIKENQNMFEGNVVYSTLTEYRRGNTMYDRSSFNNTTTT